MLLQAIGNGDLFVIRHVMLLTGAVLVVNFLVDIPTGCSTRPPVAR